MIGGFEIMAHKLMLKDIGMDSMKILYYERQAKRKKAYASKKRKSIQKVSSVKKPRTKHNSDAFSRILKEAM